MSKPTLVQSLLNRPSQTYSTPVQPKKDYYSTRQEMLRIAQTSQLRTDAGVRLAVTAGPSAKAMGGQATTTPRVGTGSHLDATNPKATHKATPQGMAPSTTNSRPVNVHMVPGPSKLSLEPPTRAQHPVKPVPITRLNPSWEEDDNAGDSDLEVFFTPNTSPRTSMASSVATITFPSGRKPSRRSLRTDAADHPPIAGPSSSSAHQPAPSALQTSKLTPKSNGTPSVPSRPPPSHGTFAAVPSTRTPSNSTANNFLDPSSTESTSLTTPYESDSGEMTSLKTKGRSGSIATTRPTAVASSSTTRQPSTSTGAKRRNAEDSARDVRLVVPAGTSTPNRKSPAPDSSKVPTSGKHKSGTIAQMNAQVSTPPSGIVQQPGQGRRVPASTSQSHTYPGRGSEAQAGDTRGITANGSAKGKEKEQVSRTTSSHVANTSPSVNRTSPAPNGVVNPPQKTPHTFSAFAPVGSSSSSSSTATYVQASPNSYTNTFAYTHSSGQRRNGNAFKIAPTSMMMSMTALVEEDEDGPFTPRMEVLRNLESDSAEATHSSDQPRASYSTSQTSAPGRSRSLRHTSPDLRRRRSRSLESSSTSSGSTPRNRSRTTHTLTAEVQALTLATPGEIPSKGTQGYTSLILPRAPAPTTAAGLSKHDSWFSVANTGTIGLSADGKIDLTRSGIAQTTMATVEVVRGLGLSRNGSGIRGVLSTFGRRRAVSGGSPAKVGASASTRRGSVDDSHRDVLQPTPGVEGTLLGFTSYRSPPNYVPSRSVLVQVWAVGVDGVDGRLVGVRFGADGSRVDEEEEEGEEQRKEEYEGEKAQELEPERTSTKKSPFAALGRSLSLSLSRNGSPKQSDLQRSSSAAHKLSPPRQNQSQQEHSHKRTASFSLKRNNTATSSATTASNSPSHSPSQRKQKAPKQTRADVGYIPGRSFVGRVLECGWDVRDEVIRKGEWVAGLLDVRKCGALAEFIVVDRHRLHRVPHPRKGNPAQDSDSPASPVWLASPTSTQGIRSPATLTLEELALLPLCGLSAYRAVRTFMSAFSSIREGHGTPTTVDRRIADFSTTSSIGSDGSTTIGASSHKVMTDHDYGHRRRALVLRGHDGAGAMAVQMLVQRGWRVSVHVPFSSVPANASQAVGDEFMRTVEERARLWGADEVIFDDGEEGGGVDDGRMAAVRVIDTLWEDGDVFDAILDTIGGKEVREAGERLLRSQGKPTAGESRTTSPAKVSTSGLKRHGAGQFTTLVGDVPERAIPSAGDNFRAGLRSLRIASTESPSNSHARVAEQVSAGDSRGLGAGKVGYAWVSITQDVDWEGSDVGETLGIVLRLALEDGIRPFVEVEPGRGMMRRPRVVPFEKAPYVFVDNGPLGDGGTVVVKVAG
ncbi:hypothetical protein NLJ89_g420 [Agrocybe chaxingu]|uniref:Uncharacterized protein n=1 Tax=Agrocybe chaxingu TaxID=84603 RepID=A0A9W8TEZ0_9AGAR|nr:hypothetical protein NLJ89_g420 [Agrocybe chaxingu]